MAGFENLKSAKDMETIRLIKIVSFAVKVCVSGTAKQQKSKCKM
jgi:hypothetical protein